VTRLLTLGHGPSDRADLNRRLRAAGIEVLVDVRRYPGSRRNPDVSRDALGEWLPQEGIAYRWEERLGGRRRVSKDADENDAWWRVEAFRAYAAHTRTPEFDAGLRQVLESTREAVTAVMCSELVWWRCHRRLVADAAMLVHGVPVDHVMPDGRLQPHEPSAGARRSGSGLAYPAAPEAVPPARH